MCKHNPGPERLLYYIPNLLTVFRIAAAPVLVLLLRDEAYGLALLLFLAAGVSDGLDGYIAKRFHFETHLGAILDPIADKILLVTSYVMLTLLDQLPFWLLVTVVFRDLLIVGGYLVLVVLDGTVDMKPTVVSKLNTVLQIVLVAFVLADSAGLFETPGIIGVLVLGVTVTTVWSGVDYVWEWGFRRDEPEEKRDVIEGDR